MTSQTPNPSQTAVPRIEYLRVRNYRALRDLEMKSLTPLTVLLGPNGSGKSTVFDVFAFLFECFTIGLRKAWDKRGRFKELRTRDQEGPIVVELKYREAPGMPLITYHLEIAEDGGGPFVSFERLSWSRKGRGRPFAFLDFTSGAGQVVTGDMPDEEDQRSDERLDSREMLAVNTLGQFARHPRVSALRRFVAGWYVSYLTADLMRGAPDAGPQERLSETGDNLPNVVQYLKEQHPDRLGEVLDTLRRRIPRLERVDSEVLTDGRLLLQIKDAPFERPIPARFASDGTLRMLAYLTLLYDPVPPPLVGIEEPENQLHPALLVDLAEECRAAAGRSQLLVTTHSPHFVNGLCADELRVLYRDERGHTNARVAVDLPGVREFMAEGAQLGHLWMENHLHTGNRVTEGGSGGDRARRQPHRRARG